MPRKRPFGVTLLSWLVLSLSVWGLVRWLAALRAWDILIEFGARLSPLYLALSGAAWVLGGILLLWGLFRGKPWTLAGIVSAVFLWLMQYWAERLFFESPRANAPFALVGSVLLFAITLISALSPKTRQSLSKSEEHEQPNESTESP